MCREWKKIICAVLVATIGLTTTSCGMKQDSMAKIRDLECTVIAEDNVPEELHTLIDGKKENAFKMTFQDQGFLYICIGYGEQSTGGYSIAMNELYETSNAVYVDTNLIGPKPEEKNRMMESYPYIVIKTEYIDKPIVFE